MQPEVVWLTTARRKRDNSSSPRKCDQCERHPSLYYTTSPRPSLTASRWPADGVLSPDGSQREYTARERVKKSHPSVFATLASRASETKKGQRTPSISGARGRRAAPDLSRQSACSACLERAARTTVSAIAGALSTKRAAPATTTLEHARRAHPALSSQRSGPRQRLFRRRPS